MTSLTDRAERAFLGALLQDPGQIGSTQFITAADFASPWHQQVRCPGVSGQGIQ
jgi:hypothetical protein